MSSDYLKHTLISEIEYNSLYKESLENPKEFWSTKATEFITWFEPWTEVLTGNLEDGDISWFKDAKLNVSYNCIDRHLKERGDNIAIIWEGDSPEESKKITYTELYRDVCRFANVMKKYGVKKGDRICIYLPMIPEAVIAMLACTRIGAVHSVVFGGFSADSLKFRITDADCKIVITSDESIRGGKIAPLKANVDKALKDCGNVSNVIVVKRTGGEIPWDDNRDVWYHDASKAVSDECEPEWMDAADPMFILYTSGSTAKPKGILHAVAGYILYAAITFKYIFDYKAGQIYWCTADVGWITGHSYLVYGPLCNGATTIVFEGIPSYPDHSRYWNVIDKYNVNIFYTSPTAIRALRKEGDKWLEGSSRKSLSLLGTVGEPINPEVWEWFYKTVGDSRCPIVDTWWQTETGGILITPLPGAIPLKPGSASKPFFGIMPAIVDEEGNLIEDDTLGRLVITYPWPGMMKTIYKDKERYLSTYLKDVPGCYLTGDFAYRDKDGYYWVMGRSDDVIKISGHRISTGEVEGALTLHHAVSEAAVVAIPHEIKGETIYAFITLKTDITTVDSLKDELIQTVRKAIGPIATIEKIQWTEALPKTRSGKIMRRILKKIANNEVSDLGDTSTLLDPRVIEDLISGKSTA